MNSLRLWAKYYYDMGFNVTHINPDKNRGKAKNIYKSPTNDRHQIANIRQSLEEMQNYDYENSTGIGTVLGFKNLRALDFDKWNNQEICEVKIIESLELLGLPANYEWVVRTPSGGFHIIFYAPYHQFPIEDNKTKAFTPNSGLCYNSNPCDNFFRHLELRYDKHLVLPPSCREDGKEYEFYFVDTPKSLPKEISNNNLKNLLDKFCFTKYDATNDLIGAYNDYLSHAFEAVIDKSDHWEYYIEYTEDEFLDFSPVYFKKDQRNYMSNTPLTKDKGFIDMTVLDERKQGSIYKKEKVLVVSRTRMGYSNVCIGSISEEGKYMRLLLPNDQKMRSSIDININDYLIIEYQDVKQIIAPHYEDISIYYAKKISTNNIPLLPYIKSKGMSIWEGSPEVLFNNKLNWPTNKWTSKGYISEGNVPNQSVGFWIPDKDMYLIDGRYEYTTDNITYSIKYVGANIPFECIYKGMLIRVSLARWWKGDYMNDKRCYLQISEFYPLEDEINIVEKIKKSIENKTVLQVNYFINGKYQIFNNVKPYKLLNMNENYYLACEVETEYKFTLFRVSKIRTVMKTETHYNFDKNILEFISYIQTPFPQYTENFKENLVEINLEIDKSKTSYFEIKKYLPSQKILERKENGNMMVSYVVTQERELEELIKKWIPYLKVIKPLRLDEKIRSDLKQYLNS